MQAQTVKQAIEIYLKGKFLNPEQIKQVLLSIQSNYKNIDLNALSYEPFLMKLIYLQVDTITLDWINDNIPQAWFKPMFYI